MEDSVHIIATLLPSVNNSTRTVSTASQRSLDYVLRQADNSKSPSLLQTKLQLLRMLLNSKDDKDLYVWLVRQFEILRQIFWITCHHTDNITSCEWMFDYHRSERYPYYNVFDVMSIVGLEVGPRGSGQVLSLHLTDTANTHNSKYYADLFRNGVWRTYVTLTPSLNQQKRRRRKEGVWTAQHGIRQHLVSTVIRHSSFTPANIRISPQLLFEKPLIPLRRTSSLTELEPSINLRAFDLISACRPSGLALSLSGQGLTGDPHALIMSICLFSESLISTQMAYNIMSAIFGLAPDDPPMDLQQRICQGDTEDGYERYRLSRIIHRRLSVLAERDFFPDHQVMVSLFISCRLETFMKYITSLEFLEIAAATDNDIVLPFLRTLLSLDHNRYHPLRDYREHMIAQIAARKRLRQLSEDNYLLDSSDNSMYTSGDPVDGNEDPINGGEDSSHSDQGPSDSNEGSLDSDEGSLDSDEGSLDSEEGSLGSDEYSRDRGEASLDSSEDSSVSSEDVWQWDQYDSPPELF